MHKKENGNLVKRGKEVYEAKLKTHLETKHKGEFVAIEPDSGCYHTGRTMSEACEKAEADHPGKKFYLVRVGSRAAVSFRHRTSV